MTSLDKLEALVRAAIADGRNPRYDNATVLKLVAAVRAAITVDKMHGDQDSHEFRALRAALEEVGKANA